MNKVAYTLLGERPVRRLAPYVYGVLVVGLFFHPHFSSHVSAQFKPFVEGFTNLIIVGFGVLTYYIYNREQKEFEQRSLETSVYIGAVNRKLPLLQNITTDLLSNGVTTTKQKNKIFNNLVGLACGTVARNDQGLLRFVEVATGRTVKEFRYSLGDERQGNAFSIGNKELLGCDASPKRYAQVARYLVIAATDRAAAIRAFLVVPNMGKEIPENVSILRAIADQAQVLLVYAYGDLSKSYA